MKQPARILAVPSMCRGADRAVILEGLPEMPIRGIVLNDVRITARRGLATVDLGQAKTAVDLGPGVAKDAVRLDKRPQTHD